MNFPHQLILFGPPGTSKSHLARHDKAGALGVTGRDIIPVTFHPEFGYGEFVCRLLPMTVDHKIEYRVHAGPFIKALARAFVRLGQHELASADPGQNVVLLIDEINRGNCAEIFGDVFQLLDRDDTGWSSYEVNASDLTLQALDDELKRYGATAGSLSARLAAMRQDRVLRLPPNLYLIGTMNTSDDSIFHMDSAFKRRWNFEFCPPDFAGVPDFQRFAMVVDRPHLNWEVFLRALNTFIVDKCTAPRLDDKLVGPWFIKARPVRQPVTLGERYASEFAELKESASKVTAYHAGADHSDVFDERLLRLIATLPPPVGADVTAYARVDRSGGRRKLKAIAYDTASEYYRSEVRAGSLPPGTLFIEDFLKGLAARSALPSHEVQLEDIAGKLFIYLWDNVFDRDKSPLAKLLGIPVQELRTFGQFAEQVHNFIARLRLPDTPSE
ncbi:AAA family ATPase [Oxalobacteraceae bacterium OM1]|nr:AAA family ATPase [Oxalobacteraceae bacterium OM1]